VPHLGNSTELKVSAPSSFMPHLLAKTIQMWTSRIRILNKHVKLVHTLQHSIASYTYIPKCRELSRNVTSRCGYTHRTTLCSYTTADNVGTLVQIKNNATNMQSQTKAVTQTDHLRRGFKNADVADQTKSANVNPTTSITKEGNVKLL